MSRVVTVDLDTPDAASLDAIWNELRRRHDHEAIAPKLRRVIERHVDEALDAGRLTPERAAEIRQALGEAHPKLVMMSFLKEIAPDRPTIGAFRDQARTHMRTCRERLRAEEEFDWREHPERLVQIVAMMRRFCTDEARVAQAAVDLAASVGMADEIAVEFAAEGIRRGREWERGHG